MDYNITRTYEPSNRELLYLKEICKKINGLSSSIPSDLKPKTKTEIKYECIYNSIK